jgi:hypothetical protein
MTDLDPILELEDDQGNVFRTRQSTWREMVWEAEHCPDCGGRAGERQVDGMGVIASGCVCDGPWGEPVWVGL